MKIRNKNLLICRWTYDKNPVRVSGKSSKEKIDIKYVSDINEILNGEESKINEQKN